MKLTLEIIIADLYEKYWPVKSLDNIESEVLELFTEVKHECWCDDKDG